MKEIQLITFIGLVIFIIAVVSLVFGCTDAESKYTVYAANHTYHCNQFTVSGNTIYFTDVDQNNVIINGDYTLIYEKALSKE